MKFKVHSISLELDYCLRFWMTRRSGVSEVSPGEAAASADESRTSGVRRRAARDVDVAGAAAGARVLRRTGSCVPSHSVISVIPVSIADSSKMMSPFPNTVLLDFTVVSDGSNTVKFDQVKLLPF